VAARRLDGIRRAVGDFDWTEITQDVPVTISIGVAGRAEVAEPTQAAMMATADRNLYAAKHGGRDRVVSGTSPDGQHRSYRQSRSAA
jgi:PleD family two-component response regulator